MSATPGTSSNPFEILGLDRSASFEDVKMAYRRLARQYHPDANPGDPGALERFTALRRAYDRLKIFYQTLDEAGSGSPQTPSSATPSQAAPTPASQQSPPITASRPVGSVRRVDIAPPAAPGRLAGPGQTPTPDAAGPAPRPGTHTSHPSSLGVPAPIAGTHRETMPEPHVSGTGSRHEHVPEPSVPGTGGRRAFRRTGPMRQSGDIARPIDVMPPAPAQPQRPASRPAGSRLVPPQTFGAGHLASRAEIVYGHPTIVPSNEQQMAYVLLGLRASDGVVFPRVPLNLCLVLDHSSSMLRGGKVDRLKETVRGIISQLDEDDYLSIVTFGDRAEVLLPAQPLRNKAMVQGAIDAMRCRGGTEISRGLAAGLTELGRNASRALSHLILLTDGQTYGDESICLERAEEAAEMQVGITAYGLGTDWNSALLDGIALPTGGHSDFIESPEEMANAFSSRVLALQSTTLRNVTLTIQPAPGCRLRRVTQITPLLRTFEPPADAPSTTAPLGDMSGTIDYRVLLEYVLDPSRPGKISLGEIAVVYDVPGLQRDGETLTISLGVTASSEQDPQQPVDPRVTDALRKITVHRLQQQAWSEINSGEIVHGTGLLKRAAEHLEAAGHAELARVAAEEAARVESGSAASDENVKRIIYGTRKLG